MDLLIVADPRDAFAGLLAGEVRRRGRTPVVLRRPDAARLFTLRGEADGTTVEPAVPILLRPPAHPAPTRIVTTPSSRASAPPCCGPPRR